MSDDVKIPSLKKIKSGDVKIPIPDPSYIKNLPDKVESERDGTMRKHEDVYDKFCKWYAIPKEVRRPKTQAAFEKKYDLPKRYVRFFKERKDFKDKCWEHFWDWMAENLKEVVYGQFKLATSKKNTQAAKFYAELLTTHMTIDKPQTQIQNFTLIGVPQEKIDKLFVPKEYRKLEEVTPTVIDDGK